MSTFWLCTGLKTSFKHKCVRKNLFPGACFFWDSGLSLRELDQKIKFGGIFGYGDSYLEFLFRHFKVIRLHAILQDAAGAVRPHIGKVSGYCHIIGRGSLSCLLRHVTGPFFRVYVKLFLPSIFNSVDFWSSLSWIVLDIELADKNFIKELRVPYDGNVQGYSFSLPEKYKPTKQSIWCTRKLHGLMYNSGCLDYGELANFF